VTITWRQALRWRLKRQFLTNDSGDAAGAVEDVVDRLTAVPAWSGDPDYAVRARHTGSEPGGIDRALADGRLVKVFAFRGATHLMTPDQAATHLAVRAAGRMWERTSWQSYYGLTPQDWPSLRQAVRESLADGPLTLNEVADAVAARGRFRHLRAAIAEANTFIKPFCWQGDVCFGPDRHGRPTLMALADNRYWPGLPDLETAGRKAVKGYLSAYGPATPERLRYWLAEGLGAGRKRLTAWLAALADQIARVDLDGDAAMVLAEHADDLASTRAAPTVRLLTGHDQWVLGPGTADRRVVPAQLRPAMTRGANIVIADGVVAGTWKVAADTLTVCCPENGAAGRRPDDRALAEQAEHAAHLLGRQLDLRIDRC
jgi:hypothetical protein